MSTEYSYTGLPTTTVEANVKEDDGHPIRCSETGALAELKATEVQIPSTPTLAGPPLLLSVSQS